ncbi:MULTISPECIES: hypothetical protein [unclassified Variovorax]|uniref:hypothetical protein n=1 Tax=unclassified Variovorax TaxID=663243 RepID=UPI00076C68FA|nr:MULTISPECIES: hypothetical protein [unclassified Variovorax]KWT72502.1 hypothetical protein APY03_6251 [Variovorax sp. WDL1]PNG47460.1 hypothetical protein CHC06_07810 [Variovorax sp. B2]PNG47889.1 hypothetical protein CHC07_07058 [Variovorax sp. B4]VTV15373.1 hypothetical protein WDL1CHR_05785 [Variovorax sp. WDL1]
MSQALMSSAQPDLWLAAIGWAYLVTNACRVLTYVPQILVVWRCNDGARSISLMTWGSWSVSHLTAVLYSAVVVADGFLVAVSLINLAGRGVVSVLAYRRRRAYARMNRVPDPLRRPRTDSI